jgi:trans-aconitate 2-methyltransferase
MAKPTTSHYTFGDQGPAAERLRRLAALYRPLSCHSLEEAVAEIGRPIALAIDLGSGPGYTTELVAEVSKAAKVIGFERSGDFCREARARLSSEIEFVEHDVSTQDLPCQNVDLALCRFLLTHIADPIVTLRRWRTALRPGGILVLIELEQLTSTDPTLARYYEIIDGVQAQHGQQMYIGAELEGQALEAGYEIVASQVIEPRIAASSMANLHRPNLENVRKDPWVRENYSEAELDEVAAGLDQIAAESDGGTPIENFLRVILARRTEGSFS